MRHRRFSPVRTLPLAAWLSLIAAAATACHTTPDVEHPPTSSPAVIAPTGSGTASPTEVAPPKPPASPPPTRGAATPSCVNGWVTPPAGSPRFTSPLGVIRRTTGVHGPLDVTDMRYFTGPESPPSDKGYLQVVERWYVRLWAERDPAFQGRFLVEARAFGRGLSAVAPYRTRGFRSPDWIGFQYDSGDRTLRAYPGLPGTWEGTPYDFVKGGEGLTIRGLPKAVAGCMDGT